MALQNSGRLTFSNIVAEFGGSPPHKLSEYYAKAVGVPASGRLAMSVFYGKSFTRYHTLGGGGSVNIQSFLAGQGQTRGIAYITLTGHRVADSTSTYAILTGNLSGFDAVYLTINGGVYVFGRGGNGGNGGWNDYNWGGGGANGAVGGHAIHASSPIRITNNGVISGGGGGGGGGTGKAGKYGGGKAGGGGGGGAPYGIGGSQGSGTKTTNGNGGNASLTGGGRAGSSWSDQNQSGGAGGGLAGVGGNAHGNSAYGNIGKGGAAGRATVGNAYITWLKLGDTRGSRT